MMLHVLRTPLLCVSLMVFSIAGWSGSQTGHKVPVLLVVGDSMSAEYGIQRNSGWVALLGQYLRTQGKNIKVVNASISGDTSAGGRARLPQLLRAHQPQWVLIELGGNDALRGFPLDMTRQNLSAMVDMSQKAKAKVLLVGMQVPPNYGKKYADDFARLFAQVAQQHRIRYVPFLLRGIADVDNSKHFFQADGIHPLELAQPKMKNNVWSELKHLL
jgi:acyl-CoA thioesterase I